MANLLVHFLICLVNMLNYAVGSMCIGGKFAFRRSEKQKKVAS